MEILKQGQYVPQRVGLQIVQLYAGTKTMPGETKTWVRDIPNDDMQRYCKELESFIEAKYTDVLDKIETVGDLKPEVTEAIEKVLKEFNASFTVSK